MSGHKRMWSVLCSAILICCLVWQMPLIARAEPVSSGADETAQEPAGSSSAPSAKPASSTGALRAVTSSAPVSSEKPASSVKPASSQTSSSKRTVSSTQETVGSLPDASSSSSGTVIQSASSEPETPSSSSVSLPEVSAVSEVDPLGSANRVPSNKMNLYGILAWVFIALGITVVLIVVLSNRRPPRGPGRSRYRKPKRGGKHLLDDKYYRDINKY